MLKHKVSEVKLKNGAKGILIHVPDASVMTFDINFRAGEFLVDEKKWEVPHLMEHVLLGANELIPKARDFQAELEKNGAYSNATTNVYDINYEAECADFEWERVLNLLLVAITKPLFLKDEYEAEYGNVQEEMVARSNNHFRRLSLQMRKDLGLIAKTDNERLELMQNVTLADVKKHYVKTHFAANMRFAVAGNITQTRRKNIISMFSDIDLPKTGKRFELPDERSERLEKPVYISNDTVDNLYFYIDTFMNRRMDQAETDAISLANTMLTETLYSKILGTARERGLVYGMSSGINYTKGITNWWFGAQVSDKNAEALNQIIVEEVQKVLNGKIDPKDILATKQYTLGRFQRSAQTVGGTAAGYVSRYFFEDVIEEYDRVPERIRAVTKTQMTAIAKELFKDNIWGFGVLGNCGEAFVYDLQTKLAPLWARSFVEPKKNLVY
ncbi:MAG TPA: pitrilysin family protein [Candidatus Sulfotelmatobacter sp.]|nr:pitrilysin family protein [Candidatus Sulfotelmatobacter sp.]